MTRQKKFSKEFQKIASLQVSANSLLNWLFQKKSISLNKEPYYIMDLFRNQLLNAYCLYPEEKKSKSIHFKKFIIPRDKKYESIRRLAKEFGKKSEYFVNIIVQGSVADSTVIKNWSDIDILAVVKEKVFENIDDFINLRKFLISVEDQLYKFDSFQHHGIQFISEADLKFYPESFLPLEALRYGKSLIKTGSLNFSIRDSSLEKEKYFYSAAKLFQEADKKGFLFHHPRNGIFLKNDFGNKNDNFYQLKYFISLVLLVPTLFIELVDGPVYKRHSFKKIRDYFDKQEDLELVDKCEKIRYLFRDLKVFGNAIPDEVIRILGDNYFKRASVLMKKLVKKYELCKSTKKT